MIKITPDQQIKLQALGITTSHSSLITNHSFLPLLSISGLTLISFGGLVLFKTKSTQISPDPLITDHSSLITPSPTQVPKSIQHYLLTSQQYFTQALEQQNTRCSSADNCSLITVNLLNQSISTATEAIKLFSTDPRGYEQRGRVYQSLIDSQPQVLALAIADLTQASNLNPNSAEITRSLATLYARQGNAQNTINYLARTVSLEPTKAQNFYDLARLQQQTGQLPAALDTYNRLITIISDPAQRTQIESEKSAIERLLSQSPNAVRADPRVRLSSPSISPLVTPKLPGVGGEGSLIQANSGSGLIIAAPETAQDISVNNLVDTNSLSGTATLPAGQKSISITNNHLRTTSQVYLTITKGGKNLSLQVLSKSKDNFVVGLDTPTTEDIQFRWWIID